MTQTLIQNGQNQPERSTSGRASWLRQRPALLKQRMQKGFTILELLTVVAIVAILGAIAVIGYQKYTQRAHAPDIITKYDALRTGVAARLAAGSVDDCAALAQNLGSSNLASDYAALSYGFEAVKDGYRPVLNVCAQFDPGSPLNVKVAREAHDVMAKTGVVEKNAVLSDSVVSFALRLTDGDAALCKTAPASNASTCGSSQTVLKTPTQPSLPVSAPAQTAVAAQPTCPNGQQLMTNLVSGTWQRACQPVCAQGQKLNPATHQCDVDHGSASASTVSGVTALSQLPAAQRQQVQAAEQKLAQSMAGVTTVDGAIAQTMAVAQNLPAGSLTQSIPGNSPVGQSVRANCKLPEFSDGACKDQVVGDFCSTLPASGTTACPVAIMCPKTLGVCQGVTPEMRRIFDQSMQRIVSDWFLQHPACTTFNQQGC